MKVRQVAFGDTTGKPTILQENELSAGPKWSKFKMSLKPSKHSQIVITLTRGLGAKGIAAISRIMVHSKQPAEEFPGRHCENLLYHFHNPSQKRISPMTFMRVKKMCHNMQKSVKQLQC